MVCYLDLGETRRIISFRKANKREEKTYEQAPLIDEDGEVRELTAEDLQLFKPIAEVDPGMSRS